VTGPDGDDVPAGTAIRRGGQAQDASCYGHSFIPRYLSPVIYTIFRIDGIRSPSSAGFTWAHPADPASGLARLADLAQVGRGSQRAAVPESPGPGARTSDHQPQEGHHGQGKDRLPQGAGRDRVHAHDRGARTGGPQCRGGAHRGEARSPGHPRVAGDDPLGPGRRGDRAQVAWVPGTAPWRSPCSLPRPRRHRSTRPQITNAAAPISGPNRSGASSWMRE
jgi:hypothetical protein